MINLYQLLVLPADQKTAVLFGYSEKRLAIIASLVLGILVFIFAFFKMIKSPAKIILSVSERMKKQGFLAALVILLFISLLLVWITGFSTERFLGSATYFAMSKRLLPLCIWLLSVSLFTIGICTFFQHSTLKGTTIADGNNWRILIISFTAMVLFFLFTYWIFPLLSDQLWWVSVPILITQIFVAWIIATFIMLIPGNFYRRIPIFVKKHSELILFILIWIISAVLWITQPVNYESEEYSLTPEQQQFILPRRPNYELYPRFDSETYFKVSESIVTGGGINRSIDKPFFLALEGLLNWLAGGSFEKMLDLQTIILASFPSVIFLLCSKTHSRAAGLFVASLAVIQGMNGIRLLDSTKVLLSEPFMQLGTALIALIAFLALKASGKGRLFYFLILGGIIGLSALIRLNTLVLIPFILLITLIHYARERKNFFNATVIFFLGIFLAFTPWMIHNTIFADHPFAFVLAKVRGVIVNNRYDRINEKLELYEVSEEDSSEPQDIEMPENSISDQLTIKPSIAATILKHFLNNTITSFSILPGSGIPQDMIYGFRNQRYWAGFDTTLYEGVDPAFFIFNLLILSIGASSIIKKHHIVGFIPIVIFIGYHLSNGIAVKSGHRYAQPVTWIVLFYYAIGLISISRILFNLLKINLNSNPYIIEGIDFETGWKRKLISASVIILLLGSTPVIADLLPIDRYPEITDADLFSAIKNEKNFQFFGEENNIDVFLNAFEEDDIDIVYGEILTPIIVNNEKFYQFYGTEDFGGDGTYLTFNFLGPSFRRFTRMIFHQHGDLVDIKNGSDAVIFLNLETDNRIAIGIGIIDPAFSSKISSYKNLSEIPFSKFYASKDNLTLIRNQANEIVRQENEK